MENEIDIESKAKNTPITQFTEKSEVEHVLRRVVAIGAPGLKSELKISEGVLHEGCSIENVNGRLLYSGRPVRDIAKR
ncbi:hypothetical protein K4754_06300 [Pseudomonas glycinae]|uniref:hypothetical protein n=1 Tax=Pseudomonas glycinae TaxID=1785145 RepID=UPI001C89FB13|nr:hypothetical protein [Pseudomonas glycinae]MBX8621635.1 hypothetical protein [Pseudomonas glycinae]